MSDFQELKEKILLFRVHELQILLRFAGSVKYGKKKELQNRAIDLVRLNPDLVRQKILELYRERYHEKYSPYNEYSKGQKSVHGSAANFSEIMPKNVDVNSLNFKENPFFRLKDDLVGPSILKPTLYTNRAKQMCLLDFRLSVEQSTMLSRRLPHEKEKLVHLKFCIAGFDGKYETLPFGLTVEVNGNVYKLTNSSSVSNSNVELRRKNEIIDITRFIRRAPMVRNVIKVVWIPEHGRVYGVTIQLVTRLRAIDLLRNVVAKEIPPSVTRNMIIQQLASDGDDDDVSTTTIKAALKCPLGRERIRIPCRALTCGHVGCFDALSFLQLNEKKDTFVCPLCNKSIKLEDIRHDRFFEEILSNARPDCSEVQFNKDGTWFEIKPAEPKRKEFELIDLVDSDSDDDIIVTTSKRKFDSSFPKMAMNKIATHPVKQNMTLPSKLNEGASTTNAIKITSAHSPIMRNQQSSSSTFKEPRLSVPAMIQKYGLYKPSRISQSTSSSAQNHVSHHFSGQNRVSAATSSFSQTNQSFRKDSSLSSSSSSRRDYVKRSRLGHCFIGSSTSVSKQSGQSEASASVSMNRPAFDSLAMARVSQTNTAASTPLLQSASNPKVLNLSKNAEQTPPYLSRFARQSSALGSASALESMSAPGSNQLPQQYPPMPPLSAMPALLRQNSAGFPSSAPSASNRMYSTSRPESPYMYHQVRQARPPPPITFLPPYNYPFYPQSLQYFDGNAPGLPNIYSFVQTNAMLQNLQNAYGGDLVAQNEQAMPGYAVAPDVISLD